MKITEMIAREDFYRINHDTLLKYYATAKRKEPLYIYPRLNAIIVKNPSKAVKKYLLTEYAVRGSFVKRLAANGYVNLCLSSHGVMADRRLLIPNDANADTLIYPCNRKYRIFDFAHNTVTVQLKSGFPDEQLKHEISFRTRSSLPDFVPVIMTSTGTSYTERIIDGKPLARVTDGYDQLKKQAYEELRAYTSQFDKTVTGVEYSRMLGDQLLRMMKEIQLPYEKLVNVLSTVIRNVPEVLLTFSHGDLQSGNIWVENRTNKVFIIDWESWGTRSLQYDQATLFDGLRPGDIDGYLLNARINVQNKALVLLEDILFQIEVYKSLPDTFGREKVIEYCRKITSWSETQKLSLR